MKRYLLLFLCAAWAAPPSLAAEPQALTSENWRQHRQAKIDPLRQEELQAKVSRESFSHQRRIEILKRADACIKAAQSHEQYRACEQQEQQAREQLRQELFTQRKMQMLERLRRQEQHAKQPEVQHRVQQKIACVEAATTPESLQACHRRLLRAAPGSGRGTD